jgi:hypothetical protein
MSAYENEFKNEKGWALFRGFFTRASVPHSSFWVRWLVGVTIAVGMMTAAFLVMATGGFLMYVVVEVFAIHPGLVLMALFIAGFGTLIASFKP